MMNSNNSEVATSPFFASEEMLEKAEQRLVELL